MKLRVHVYFNDYSQAPIQYVEVTGVEITDKELRLWYEPSRISTTHLLHTLRDFCVEPDAG